MNLIEQFDKLDLPNSNDGRILSASQIEDFSHFRIAVNNEGHPVILLSVSNPVRNLSLKNFRLKYLQLAHNIECKIVENDRTVLESFTVITFTSQDRHLQEYFLRICESLVRSLKTKPTQEQVGDSVKKLIEVFRALNDTPTNTVQGLWAELFLIEISTNPMSMLNYWHNIPQERFDFNSGEEKIEIKSSGNFERIHTFSAEQLNPPSNTSALIGSVFIRPRSTGKSIQDLINSITERLGNDVELIDKVNSVVIRTLGSSLEQSLKMKFDYQVASESFKFYRHQDIKRIEEISIPTEVTEVRYKSDLTAIESIALKDIEGKGELYDAI
ncbi:PD-(D/E)XK motif protein [Robiginitalea biformata]|uniref:PD-(D/E)XK motif protein n=1 Tax=Robiginitalea biformata TaxID=252307 RepID=UPI00100123C3|nr:MAG: hypothetical protein DSY77_10210 [Bacteroidota bacterium]